MFIFESGLLASFIPEILMVFAFIFCLIVKSPDSSLRTENDVTKIVELSSSTPELINPPFVYRVTTADFQSDQAIQSVNISVKVIDFKYIGNTDTKRNFNINKIVEHFLFQRPPPVSLG